MEAIADWILFEVLYQDKLARYRAYNWSHHGMTREAYARFPLPDVLKDRRARDDWRIGG